MTIGSFLEKKKIREYIDRHHMLERGDSVVLGLSGGPDSVCLFFVLLKLKEEYELDIHALHVNHMIRGQEADRDQNYVRELCQKQGIDLVEVKLDIPAMARISGRSLEEEARIARYHEFDKLAEALSQKNQNEVKIAVAHNADDNAETVLFHMARGCGLDGACGIAAVRENIIRPLLQVSKREILDCLKDNGIAYCLDSTNQDTDYDRNRIRHNIMPQLCQVNDKALEHISDMTDRLTDIADFLNQEAAKLLQAGRRSDGSLEKEILLAAHQVVVVQALKIYLREFMPMQKDLSAVHIESVYALLNEAGEKRVNLPHGKTLIISYDRLYVIDTAGENQTKETDALDFELREFDLQPNMAYPQNTYTKWFDCDKIAGSMAFRTRQPGDYMIVNNQGNRKLLKDYFINEKIPKSQRDSIPLVCDGSHVMWVVGHRISEYYKITDSTVRVLEIHYRKG